MVESRSESYARSSAVTEGGPHKAPLTYVSPERRRGKPSLYSDIQNAYTGVEMSKVGRIGSPVNIISNQFRVAIDPSSKIHMYSVKFNPEIQSQKLKAALIHQCEDIGPLKHFNGTNLYLKYKTESSKYIVKTKRDEEYIIEIDYVQELPINSQGFNNMIGSMTKKTISSMRNLVQIGTGMYIMSAVIPLTNYGMKIVKGYTTTILPHEDSCMLTINLSNKIMSMNTVLGLMKDIMRNNRSGDPKRAIVSELLNKTVFCEYNNKTYKIDDVDFDNNPESTFQKRQKDGTMTDVSYYEYFRNQYNKEITDKRQPLLISRPKKMGTVGKGNVREDPKQICLIPELCILTGIPDSLFTNFNFKKDMMNAINTSPEARTDALHKFIDNFKSKDSEAYKTFADWGFKLEKEPCKIQGRRLDQFDVMFGQNKVEKSGPTLSTRNQMYDCQRPIEDFFIFSPDRDSCGKFMSSCMQVARGLGVRINVNKRGDRNTIPYQDARSLKEGLFKLQKEGNIDMVIVILKNADKTLYDVFKKYCCEHGIPSQGILRQKLNNPKGLMSVMTKVAIQMSVKLGGAPWAVKFPAKEKFMIVGMDTYHDSNVKGQSACAVVATCNNQFTKFTWDTCMLQNRQEINSTIKPMFRNLLIEYAKRNGSAPEKIIIYRDGVGEGQVSTVLEFEYEKIREAVGEFAQETGMQEHPQIAYLTISKRIESRFFACRENRGRMDQVNCPAGTIIDTVATFPNFKDFYHIPLDVRQGTMAPIHYRLHKNSLTNFCANKLQYTTNVLCNTYYNWNGPIKVPSVAQYAHKLAYLMGTHLHTNPNRDLANQLFFL